MAKYVCEVCGWEYDPEVGVPEAGIERSRQRPVRRGIKLNENANENENENRRPQYAVSDFAYLFPKTSSILYHQRQGENYVVSTFSSVRQFATLKGNNCNP